MPGVQRWPLTAPQTVTLAVAALLAVLGIVIGYRAWKASRVTPEERERRRRAALVQAGKLADATLVEVREDLYFYTYDVRGVEYTASQDVSALRERVPQDLSAVGVVAVKYDPRNPANSIIVAEEWNGLRWSVGQALPPANR
jgi:hypothetical protein